jgi:hypothetical protein
MSAFTRACVVAAVASCLTVGTATATTITIDDKTDTFGPVGDFFLVSGNDHLNSSPGQVIEVLGGPGGTLKSNDGSTESETRSLAMGDLWDTLDAGGLTYASKLVFGFGNNQSGSVGSNWTDTIALTLTFNLPGGGAPLVFDLGSNDLHIYNYIQGQSHAEARIGVDLGFNFMTMFDTDSLELFTISSSINHGDDGYEIYFLSSGYTGDSNPLNPVPEPASLLLLGTGFALIARSVRRADRNRNS